MYQEHLHKITEDGESQRYKRDEIIKSLRKQVTAMDVELQRTRVQLEADRYIWVVTVFLIQARISFTSVPDMYWIEH